MIQLTSGSLRLIGRLPATFVYLIPYGGLAAAVQFSCLVVVCEPRYIAVEKII
jgi:hypothetical protein